MFTYLIEFFSLLLCLGCLWHAARFEGRAFAQQWFVGAYLYVFVREVINQVVLQTYTFAPEILRIGVVPALVGLLWGAIFYLAYQFARRFISTERFVPIAALMFLIASSFALPIEATAAQLQWWTYPDAKRTLFGGMPLIVPFIWGGAAVIFYAVFRRVNQSRLPDQGKFYAMVTAAPIISLAHLLYALVLGFFA
jgi:hypothetical protein